MSLFKLINENNYEKVKSELKRIKENFQPIESGDIPPEFSEKNTAGDSLLHAALKKDNFKIFQELLSVGVPLQQKDIKSNSLDVIKDQDGNSILHLAVQQCKFEYIQELLFLDFPLNDKNKQNLTALDIAEERVNTSNSDNDHKIAALLRTRHAWQDETVGFRFNRVVRLLENAFPSVEPARNKDKFLVIGRTGAGKSTLLNYINGAQYDLGMDPESGKRFAELVGGKDKAIADVGMGMVSQTLYPQVIARDDLDYVYCDLAGLFDSRGDEERICASSSIQILSRLPGKIKGILVVLDLPSFQPKGAEFKRTALALSEIIQKNEKLMDSIYFSITHVPKELLPTIKAQGILNKFVIPLQAYYAKESQRRLLDPEEQSLKFMLDLMVKGGEERIKIPNITDKGESKKILEEAIKKLAPKNADQFNFINHDGSQESFNAVLLKISHEYLNMNRILEETPKKIQLEKNVQKDELKKIEKWTQEIKTLDAQAKKPFDPSFIDTQITTKESEIANNNATILTKKTEIQNYSNKIGANRGELSQLETDERIHVKSIAETFSDKRREHRIVYTSPHPLGRLEPKYSGWGHFSYTLEKPKHTGIYVMQGNERVGIYEWDENARNGNYQGLYGASNGLASASVEVYTSKRHLHRARIADLNREISDCFTNRLTAEGDIRQMEARNKILEKEILDAKTAKIQGAADQSINKIRLEGEIKHREEWIKIAKEKVESSKKQESAFHLLLRKTKAELEVNGKLFEIVYKVTAILDFMVDHIPTFRNLYESLNPKSTPQAGEKIQISDKLNPAFFGKSNAKHQHQHQPHSSRVPVAGGQHV